MGLFSNLDISAAGMDVQQARLQIASTNLANSRTTRNEQGEVYRPLRVVIHSQPLRAEGENGLSASGRTSLPVPVVAGVEAVQTEANLVFDPGHPDANAEGFVAYPGIDQIQLMMELVSISRSYEANLRAFDVTRSLLQRTLELGSRR